MAVFIISLICPLIANDKPLLMQVNDTIIFLWEEVNHQTLGGEVPIGINYLTPSFQKTYLSEVAT